MAGTSGHILGFALLEKRQYRMRITVDRATGLFALPTERTRIARFQGYGPARQNASRENFFPPPDQRDHLLASHQFDEMRDR